MWRMSNADNGGAAPGKDETKPAAEPAGRAEGGAAAPPPPRPREVGGPAGPEPTRFGDWERKGRVGDF